MVALLSGPALCATSCSLPQPLVSGQCSSVKLLLGTSNRIHVAVLQKLCEQGWSHVLAQKSTTPSQQAPVRRAKQFAVVNLHRDSFIEAVSWTSGDGRDVVCDPDWFVDAEVELTNGYRWYLHGLPLWPLLNQTLAPPSRPNPFKRKKLDWPSYAFATPLYLVPHEWRSFRDPNIGVQKLFSNDLAPTSQQNLVGKPVDAFAKPDKFQAGVTQLLQTLGAAINEDPEDYKNWLLPLVRSSLPSMIESFKARQSGRGPRKSGSQQVSTCPDLLYVFFLKQPCLNASSCMVLSEVQLALRKASCSTTSLIVGHS
ncbi:hypothetical protein Pcinc_017160 [Petrolisthes cinctipes]|uniref:Uncharacterized protein n=1 Tax=Petrolisthes cinctipes TaxID=88211 RepID=A0AAE1FPM9_PETCI|nr:hypothetical protein Pcinc_017160 [Petrolisthes cinctipes]